MWSNVGEPMVPPRAPSLFSSVIPLLVVVELLGRGVLDQRGVFVDAALELVGVGPATGALFLARRRRTRAGDAPDRPVARLVQRVVRNLVDRDVGPDALL